MEAILEDLSPEAVVAAMEANFAAYYLPYATLPDGELHDEPGCTWFVSGVPERWFNGVLKTGLKPGQTAVQIEKIQAEFRKRNLPMLWNVGPNVRPAGLGDDLLAHGFRLDSVEPGLALDLAALDEETQPPPGLSVEAVESEAALEEWTAVWMENVPDPTARHVREAYHALGLRDAAEWRFYLARLNGAGVATCLLFYSAGIVSVQHVATRKKMQRRGIGKTLLVHALRDARTRGYRVAALTSTLAGLSLYRRLGFQILATFSGYSFQPELDRPGNLL